MTNEKKDLTLDYLKEMQEKYIEGYGYEAHPLPEWYALDEAIKAIEQLTDGDLISRKDAIEMAIEGADDWDGGCSQHRAEKITEYINRVPSVKPKVGRWDFIGYQMKAGRWDFIGYQMFQCTSCGEQYTQDQLESLRNYTYEPQFPKYCPSCGSYNGAKMEVEDEVSD